MVQIMITYVDQIAFNIVLIRLDCYCIKINLA